MLIRSVTLGVVLAGVVFMLAASGRAAPKDLDARITVLEGAVAALQGQLGVLQANNTALQGTVTTLQGQVDALQVSNVALQGQIGALQTDIACGAAAMGSRNFGALPSHAATRNRRRMT